MLSLEVNSDYLDKVVLITGSTSGIGLGKIGLRFITVSEPSRQGLIIPQKSPRNLPSSMPKWC